jgi:hypothetical protein
LQATEPVPVEVAVVTEVLVVLADEVVADVELALVDEVDVFVPVVDAPPFPDEPTPGPVDASVPFDPCAPCVAPFDDSVPAPPTSSSVAPVAQPQTSKIAAPRPTAERQEITSEEPRRREARTRISIPHSRPGFPTKMVAGSEIETYACAAVPSALVDTG